LLTRGRNERIERIIHDEDGSIEQRESYGSESRRRKGVSVATSVIRSRPTPGTLDDARAWIVTVRTDDGTEHDIEVLAETGELVPSASLPDVFASNGESVVQAALTADPTRIPTRVTCSAEGFQPEY
jgi:hypothetical protein